jgi:polar amino acid transport system substrate-binding protein
MRKFLLAGLAVLLGLGAAAQQVIIVGTSADWPPFEWVDANGNYVGFDMDLMRLIAALHGYQIEIQDIGFDALIPALEAGRIDIAAAGMTITAGRAERVDFSAPYWSADQGVLVKEDSELNLATALSLGHKVGAQLGTTQAEWLEEAVAAGADITVELYERNELGIMDLVAGRIDVFVADTPVARTFTKLYPVKMIGIIITGEELGFAVQKGDPKGLLPLINSGIARLKELGAWDFLVQAYFGGDLEKITACYAEARGLLEAGDLVGYARTLADCMTE